MNLETNLTKWAVKIGKRLRTGRKEVGLSLTDLSRLSGCTTSTLLHIERGTRDVKLSTLVALADALRIDFTDLVEHFLDLMPESATNDAVYRLKNHIAEVIIQSYGSEYLAEISNFFRTQTGERMLIIARQNELFKRLHRQSPHGGPVERWKTYLSLGDLSHYRAFTNTPAGKFFVQQTWAVRRKLHYEIHEISRWPNAPLDQSYFVEILEADGILKFPNRTMRTSLIQELSAADP